MERLDQSSLSSFNKAYRDTHVPPVLALVPPAPQAGALPKSYFDSFLLPIRNPLHLSYYLNVRTCSYGIFTTHCFVSDWSS